MKKFLMIFILFISMMMISGCDSNSNHKIAEASLDDNGDIIINEEEITNDATYITYKVDDINIGFIAVRGTDGSIKIAFNTCQSCSPSPDAYFIQKGEYFVCQNCGTKFHVDDLGKTKYGCNPLVVEELTEEDGIITISRDYVESFKDSFKNWKGPTI